MKRVLFGITALFLAGTSTVAGSAATDHASMLISPSMGRYVPPPAEPGGLVTIYDNLAHKYPKGLYNSVGGHQIVGPQNLIGSPQFWEAAAFTPSADHVVTRIQIGATYQSGTNEVVVALYNDNGGLPGTALKIWHARDLAVACCGLIAVKSDPGIPVSAGQQYWVVMMTDKTDRDVFAIWNYNVTDQVDPGTVAYYCVNAQNNCTGTANQWALDGFTLGLAFAVLGQ
jgi:hypothetical protein